MIKLFENWIDNQTKNLQNKSVTSFCFQAKI